MSAGVLLLFLAYLALVCSSPLQALVDAASPGATVLVPPEIYREFVLISKPLTLDGQGQAEIRGSDVWSSWNTSGSYWTSGPYPVIWYVDDPTRCADGSSLCLLPEQVFIDGVKLTRVLSTPRSGQFTLDSNRTLILADDPTGRTVEVTTRSYWLNAAADDVTVTGFTFRHAGSGAQDGAISNRWYGTNYGGFVLRDSKVLYGKGEGVTMGAPTNTSLAAPQLLNNEIAYNGQLGVGGSQLIGGLVQNNVIHDNNIDRYASGWEAGGLKLALINGTIVENNTAYNNWGPGFWCDVYCEGGIFRNNYGWGNMGALVMYEISNNGRIYNNAGWSNSANSGYWGWYTNILVSSSSYTEVYDNVGAWATAVSHVSQNRSHDVTHNYFHDNLCLTNQLGIESLGWWSDWNGPTFDTAANNHGFNNWYWYPGPENGYWRWSWNPPQSFLADWQALPGGQGGGYLNDTNMTQICQQHGIPQHFPAAITRNTTWDDRQHIPGLVFMQFYDNGGEGVAYHDTTPGNSGGGGRTTDGVDLFPVANTDLASNYLGYNVSALGDTQAGEWLMITISNWEYYGYYQIDAVVASAGPGGSFSIDVREQHIATFSIPDTGSNTTWQTVTQYGLVQAGGLDMRLTLDSNGPSGSVGTILALSFTKLNYAVWLPPPPPPSTLPQTSTTSSCDPLF